MNTFKSELAILSALVFGAAYSFLIFVSGIPVLIAILSFFLIGAGFAFAIKAKSYFLALLPGGMIGKLLSYAFQSGALSETIPLIAMVTTVIIIAVVTVLILRD